MAQFPSTELPWKPSVKYLTTLYPRNLASPRQSWISADVLLKCIKDIPPRLALWLREAESGWDKILLVTRYAISCQGVWALLCVLLSSCSKEEGKLTIWSWQRCRGKERASGTRGVINLFLHRDPLLYPQYGGYSVYLSCCGLYQTLPYDKHVVDPALKSWATGLVESKVLWKFRRERYFM